MLGKTQEIDETNKENFRNASMAHILAISGMHITYIIIGVNLTINKLLGKRKTQILTIIILIFYLFLTNFFSISNKSCNNGSIDDNSKINL